MNNKIRVNNGNIFFFDTNCKDFLPITPYRIQFTSSVNNQTSTLNLTFITPPQLLNSAFFLQKSSKSLIISLVSDSLKFSTKEINLIWVKGRPVFIQARFLITSEAESIQLKILLYNNFDCIESTAIKNS